MYKYSLTRNSGPITHGSCEVFNWAMFLAKTSTYLQRWLGQFFENVTFFYVFIRHGRSDWSSSTVQTLKRIEKPSETVSIFLPLQKGSLPQSHNPHYHPPQLWGSFQKFISCIDEYHFQIIIEAFLHTFILEEHCPKLIVVICEHTNCAVVLCILEQLHCCL